MNASITEKTWNYSEMIWKRAKDSSFANQRETLKYFRLFIKDFCRILKISKSDIQIDKSGKTHRAILISNEQKYEIKHIEMKQSIESPKVGVYDWLKEDIFRLSIIGETGYLSFNAFVIKKQGHLRHLELLFN